MKRSEALLVANGAIGVCYIYCPNEREELLTASSILNEMTREEEAKEEQE